MSADYTFASLQILPEWENLTNGWAHASLQDNTFILQTPSRSCPLLSHDLHLDRQCVLPIIGVEFLKGMGRCGPGSILPLPDHGGQVAQQKLYA